MPGQSDRRRLYSQPPPSFRPSSKHPENWEASLPPPLSLVWHPALSFFLQFEGTIGLPRHFESKLCPSLALPAPQSLRPSNINNLEKPCVFRSGGCLSHPLFLFACLRIRFARGYYPPSLLMASLGREKSPRTAPVVDTRKLEYLIGRCWNWGWIILGLKVEDESADGGCMRNSLGLACLEWRWFYMAGRGSSGVHVSSCACVAIARWRMRALGIDICIPLSLGKDTYLVLVHGLGNWFCLR